MKFSCNRDILLDAIMTASRAAAVRSPLPVLEGLLIEAGNRISITGYDLKKGIFTSIDANIEEKGAIVIMARLLGEIVRSLPEGEVTVTTGSGNSCRIVCDSADFNIIGMDASDFPELPAVDSVGSVKIPQNTIKKMINETLFAVSDNESRPIYTGSLFEITENELTIVSVDGYRLALRREPVDVSEAAEFIVPGIALSELEKICSDSDEMVMINLGSKHISFSIDETVLISRRLEGEFMDYKKSVPSEFETVVVADRATLVQIVDRVSLVIDDRTKNPLRLIFDDDQIRFSCLTPRGKAEDLCSCSGSGGGLEIGFSNRYLRDALKAAPSERLRIMLNTGTSPCVIKPEEGESFQYMILPVRLRADGISFSG